MSDPTRVALAATGYNRVVMIGALDVVAKPRSNRATDCVLVLLGRSLPYTNAHFGRGTIGCPVRIRRRPYQECREKNKKEWGVKK